MSKLIVSFVCALFAVSAAAAEVKPLLKDADAFRLAPGPMVVETQVQVLKSGKLDKERRYTVYVKPGRKSLVLFKSPSEAGQKLLMSADDFWLMMPGTGRPIRVTPQQKLLGDASTGDIATLSWNEDYDGTVAGESTIDGRVCLRLDLTAQRTGVTYARIELYLVKATAEPVRADLFVASDRLAKQAFFKVEEIDGRRQVSSMRLVDQIQTSRETLVTYVSRKPKTVPDEVFNPMFLARGDFKE
ncbi:MAG: outer membrane lipoprotein-sorting protein [Betaproteobacteria bacterium]|nr:outer membrane lipoprotein-sorting protein [Betaproteobacteria bacterium]